jgi:PEP-CTERM motif-containing protein
VSIKHAVTLSVLTCTLLTPLKAQADPLVLTTRFATAGTFNCLWTLVCGGEGTNSITFGTGNNTATVTFTGVNTTSELTTSTRPVTLGEFQVTASPGFTFPTNPANPILPILGFGLTFDQFSPVDAQRGRVFGFGPGGRPNLKTQQWSSNWIGAPTGRTDYPSFVFTLDLPFTLEPNLRTALTADAALTPEPGTMILLGTGLVGASVARRRRKQKDAEAIHRSHLTSLR